MSGPAPVAVDADAVNLSLGGDADFKRRLMIRLWMGRLTVALYAPENLWQMLAYVSCPVIECDLATNRRELWVGRTAFDLTADEAAELAAKLGPLGLKLRSEPARVPS